MDRLECWRGRTVGVKKRDEVENQKGEEVRDGAG